MTPESADVYVTANVIENDDWLTLDAARKQTLLNVAVRELSAKYDGYTIPDEAVYEFAAVLSVAFNDTNRFAQQGVKSLTVKGASFSFKDASGDISRLIPTQAARSINADPANADLPKVSAGRRTYTTIIG